MDPAQYYITTLTTAFSKIGPLVLFVVGGYFIFIKLPFLFLKKSMDDQKKSFEQEKKEPVPKLERVTRPPQEEKKQEKKDGPKQKEEPKRPAPKPKPAAVPTPEEVLGLRPGEIVSQGELKKRYFELLKQNHPDRVASMGPDFKKLAEKNTKDINDAYQKLKSKAS